jgi:hypothetical protein
LRALTDQALLVYGVAPRGRSVMLPEETRVSASSSN